MVLIQLPAFEVKQGSTEVLVSLRVKVHKRALYKWQYSANPENQQWVTGDSTYTSKTVIGELTQGHHVLVPRGGNNQQTRNRGRSNELCGSLKDH